MVTRRGRKNEKGAIAKSFKVGVLNSHTRKRKIEKEDGNMEKKVVATKKVVDKDLASKVLKPVASGEKAFYFATNLGKYTGKSASSLTDFSVKLKTINVESVDFHFSRQDFEKWIKETLGDAELAKQLNGIKGLKGEALRREILQMVEVRLAELKNAVIS